MSREIHVSAASRLHFGMFSFGHANQRQFGGVGVMVNRPKVELSVAEGTTLRISGPLAERVTSVIGRLVREWEFSSPPACTVHVKCAPPPHTGLGVGTQLDLAVAAGLRRFCARPDLSAIELAGCTGRGTRSAIGTHGFVHGGLLVDAGKLADEPLGTLESHYPLPSTWRIVLIRTSEHPGTSGTPEKTAFKRLTPVPQAVTDKLWEITHHELLPAVHKSDFARFGEAVYQFGLLAGGCFAEVQNGPFASQPIQKLIDAIRAQGVAGTGQSSWGPTVFAFTGDQNEAEVLSHYLTTKEGIDSHSITIAEPDNVGATIT
jgi:beta-RFAP synthase